MLNQQEQIHLVNGQSFFGAAGLPEQGIPRLQLLDGGTGLNFEQLFGDLLSAEKLPGIGSAPLRNVLAYFYTPELLPDEDSRRLYEWITARLQERVPDLTSVGCYPPGMMLGATWEPEVIEKVGHALGHEARAYGVHLLLGTPNVNLHRDPRNGRCFEGYSEDPFLVASLAPALVGGVQAEGVAANVKHFAANNQETNRVGINEHISERALHELYYPGFSACVKAGVASVMAAYNQINGVACTENRAMLKSLLRDEWGFEGLVMSDWGAVYHPAAAVNAGTDLNMPGPVSPDALKEALEDGSLDPVCLEESAERVERLTREYARPATGTLDRTMTDQAAYDAAAEGIVMLKNENDCCPLPKSAKIELYGAEELLTCGEGSAGIHTTRNVPLLSAMRQRFSEVQYGEFDGADTMMIVCTLPGREGNDRRDLNIPAEQTAEWASLLSNADRRGMRKILILNISAPVVLKEWEKRFDAIFCIFLCGMQGANALADILCGAVNPSGHLPLTFPLHEEEMPTACNFPGDGMEVTYGEGIFVGYRWYSTLHRPCLYPFGYGLSYTTFRISGLQADRETMQEKVNVTVCVENTGKCGGKTVVQLYVSDPVSHLTKPLRELKAFRKLWLEAGEMRELTFSLSAEAFASWDPNLHAWTVEEGIYRIEAGFSAEEICEQITVYADVESPYRYGANTSIKTIYEDKRLCEILHSFLEQQGIPWDVVLSCYEYTAQDSLQKLFDMTEIPEAEREELYTQLRTCRKP